MKKATFLAAAMLAGITMTSGPLQTQAAQVKTVPIKNVMKVDTSTLKDYLNSYQFENCKIITIPCLPGTGDGSIEIPDTDQPETDQPDINVPDNNVPDNNVPDNTVPDTETPDQDDSVQTEHANVLRVVELVNAERAKAGLKALTLKKNITAAAQVRAVETETRFSHTRPNGSNFSTALTEAGVNYRGSGENIAWGQKTPEQVMEGWMNSPGHRANILNEKYTSIGVGYHQNASGVNYWTQLFTY